MWSYLKSKSKARPRLCKFEEGHMPMLRCGEPPERRCRPETSHRKAAGRRVMNNNDRQQLRAKATEAVEARHPDRT
jgi:hypothetical protein